jgi:signal transduction histidine kinase
VSPPVRWLARRTLRVQLTLLYAGPFFISGLILLAVPLLGVKRTAPVGSGAGAPPEPTVGIQHSVVTPALSVAGLVVVSLVLGWLVAGRFLRPLRTIIATARDISATNLHRRLGLRGRASEFTELADTLDGLFGRLEAAFEAQRHFVANASHELRTPLTAERALLQVALADPAASTDSLRAACQHVLALGTQQEHLIDALLTLACGEQGIERRRPFDLADLAAAAVRARLREADRRDIRVDALLHPAPAAGDPDLVTSMVANLLDNALRHNTPGGHVEIETATTATGRAHLSIRNTGPAIPADQLDRLFRPFQRLGATRAHQTPGHGLGLAIVHAIAKAHDAALVPHARPGGGLDIDLTFP